MVVSVLAIRISWLADGPHTTPDAVPAPAVDLAPALVSAGRMLAVRQGPCHMACTAATSWQHSLLQMRPMCSRNPRKMGG
jgi:hypothetical protein